MEKVSTMLHIKVLHMHANQLSTIGKLSNGKGKVKGTIHRTYNFNHAVFTIKLSCSNMNTHTVVFDMACLSCGCNHLLSLSLYSCCYYYIYRYFSYEFINLTTWCIYLYKYFYYYHDNKKWETFNVSPMHFEALVVVCNEEEGKEYGGKETP